MNVDRSLLDQMAKDSSAQKEGARTPDKLKTIADLAQDVANFDLALAAMATQQKQVTESRRVVLEETLPEIMGEVGMSSFVTEDGFSISIIDFLSASITVANRERAFAWLRKHGYEDIIKSQVSALFGKGEDDDRGEFIKHLEEEDIDYDSKVSVHAGTLKSFIKSLREERSEADNPDESRLNPPTELFSIYEAKRATVKTGE